MKNTETSMCPLGSNLKPLVTLSTMTAKSIDLAYSTKDCACIISFNCRRNICRSHPGVPEEAGPPSRPPGEIHLECSFLTPAMDFVLPVSLDCFILWTSFQIHPRLFLVLLFWDCWLDFEDLSCLKLQSLFGLLAPDLVLPCCVNLVTLPPRTSLRVS